ncbi:MAG TPA: tetratricopeptide repeat protein [Anaerolineae bacterium]|nr:tetratricopeptide repeat protein [Anaerolineae bacterium]
MAVTTTTSANIIEVTDQTFAADVLEKSKTVPVVVDFWAAWCGPCRMLGPILEDLAVEFDGAFILAKIDVDRNQQYARQFGVQGIPAVKAFKDGRLANEFTGALPEPQVRRFIEGLVPSEAEILTQKAFELEVNNKFAIAEETYRAALAKKSDHYAARVGLGRVLLIQGEIDQGIELLESVPENAPERIAANALLAGAQFQSYATGQTVDELKAKLATDPNDVASHYALASLYATQQQYVLALDEFLEVVRRDRQFEDDGARKAMLALFSLIGEGTDITKSYRQKLANALF